jgi:hypothetical protein
MGWEGVRTGRTQGTGGGEGGVLDRGVPDGGGGRGGARGGGGGDGRVSKQRGRVKLAAWIMCACGILGPLVLHPLPHQWSRLC